MKANRRPIKRGRPFSHDPEPDPAELMNPLLKEVRHNPLLWLLAFIPTCDVASLRRIALSPAGGLPLLLVAFGVLGMFWADVAWAERSNGIRCR